MTHSFELLKNGNVAKTVWANKTTKEIYPANRNSFGYNAIHDFRSDFYKKYSDRLKINQGKSNYSQFSYSAKNMEQLGFELVMRGTAPLF